eukprot:5267356-Amphidinium_carterae.1
MSSRSVALETCSVIKSHIPSAVMLYHKGAPQNSKDNAKKEQHRVLDYNAFAKKQLLGYAKKGCPFDLPKDSWAIFSLRNLNSQICCVE